MTSNPRLEDIRRIDDGFDYALRVEVTSDDPAKVQRFCRKLIDLILNEPGYAGDDVAVSVHRAAPEMTCGCAVVDGVTRYCTTHCPECNAEKTSDAR